MRKPEAAELAELAALAELSQLAEVAELAEFASDRDIDWASSRLVVLGDFLKASDFGRFWAKKGPKNDHFNASKL